MEPSDIYKELFDKTQKLCEEKPISAENRPKVQKLLDELDAVWARMGYREREMITTWCASQAGWIDE